MLIQFLMWLPLYLYKSFSMLIEVLICKEWNKF